MGIVQIPIMNPIRIHPAGTVIDYDTYLPNQDLMYLREKYQRGVEPVETLYPNFVVGKTISLQVGYDSEGTGFKPKLRNIITGVVYNMSHSIIQLPGTPVINISYQLTTEGFYRVEVELENQEPDDLIFNLISDVFSVKSWAEGQDMVKISFYDDQNRYGGYFFESIGTQFWNPTAYYTGKIEPSTPSDDQAVYTNDPGEPLLLNATPTRVSLLTLADIHYTYIDVIKTQSVCNNFYVNDLKFHASDFEVGITEKSDVVNITMKLTLQDNDYYIKY